MGRQHSLSGLMEPSFKEVDRERPPDDPSVGNGKSSMPLSGGLAWSGHQGFLPEAGTLE